MASDITNPAQAVSAPARQAAKVKSYVNQQLEKTRKQVKTVDLIAGGLVLIAFAIGFLMLAALVDGWVWALPHWARWACLFFLVAGCVAYTLISIVPLLLKRINPDYAAKMIEEAKPSFQNSLLNYVSLRKRPEMIKPAVFDAVSRQAAANLATVPEDATVDRSKLIRLGFVLIGLTLFAVGYKMLSPKDPLQTVARIVYPGGKIAKPAVVKIEDVKPGDAKVFFGEQLDVTAVVRGRHNPEDVRLIYSTLDGQHVEQTIGMTPDSASNRYRAAFSMAGGGIQQSLRYRIVVRDGVSPEYEVTVQPNPAITIESLVLQPPAYTKMKARTLAGQGDIDAIEGTKVTVHAVTNLPIKLAYIELLNEVRDPNQPISEIDYDSRYRAAAIPIEMQSEGTSATGNFQITLNSRERPIASHYRLRFVSTDDNRNSQPNVYPIRIIPDLAPEIRFRNPDTRDIDIPVNASFPILLEANDLDFEIKSVELKIDHQGSRLLEQKLELSSEDGNRRVTAGYRLRPADLGLKVGDTATFFGTAADNQMSPYSPQPDPNISRTENYSFKVTAPDESAEKDPDNQNEPNQNPENGAGEDNQDGSQDDSESEKGENEPDSNGSKKSDESTDENEKGNEKDDSGGGESEKDTSTDDPGNQNKGQQESDKPGNEEDSQTGENGDSDSPEQSDEGDKSNPGGSATQQPKEQPDQKPEGGGGSGEDSGKGEASASQDDASKDKGGSGSDSKDDSTANNGGGSSPTDPSGGDPKSNPDSKGGENSKDGGRQDDSLTSGAKETVSDNASQSELMRKMQEHFENQQDENQQNESPDKGEENDPKNPDSSTGESGSSDPKQDDTGKGESGSSDPKQDDAGKGESGSSDPKQDDTGKGESGSSDPKQVDTGKGESGSSDPKQDDTGKGESGSSDPKQDDTGKGESGSSDPKQDDTGKGESGSSDPKQDDTGKGESGSSDPKQDDAGKGESGSSDPKQDDAGKGESGSSDPKQDDAGKGESGSSDPKQDDAGKGESGSSDPKQNDVGKGGSGKEKSGKGESSNGEPEEGEAANAKSGKSESGTGGSKKGEPGEKTPGTPGENADGNRPGSAASGTKPGAGSSDQPNSPNAKDPNSPGGTGKGVGSAEGEQLKREERNREHAKKATDMILNRLSEQKNDPDPELLRKLKMSKEDLAEFFNRWDEMRRKAETGDVSAQKKYHQNLKSLGLKPKSGHNAVKQNQDIVEGLIEDGAINEPPPELVPDFNSFIRDLGRVRDN